MVDKNLAVLLRHVSIAGRSRVGSTPRGETGSVRTLSSVSCVHTNLQLEHRLELYEGGMLPWALEMTVEEPLSDDEDEDGVPHCVSDSESESENDSD